MKIYSTRYQANKDKRGSERIVRVCGGYVLMDERTYRDWRSQR